MEGTTHPDTARNPRKGLSTQPPGPARVVASHVGRQLPRQRSISTLSVSIFCPFASKITEPWNARVISFALSLRHNVRPRAGPLLWATERPRPPPPAYHPPGL